MKTLGLLGGMSWESSVEYERIINQLVQEKVGGVASANLVIKSFNFAEIERRQAAGEWDEAGEMLAAAALQLQQIGAEAIVLCTNTMHKVADQIEAAISVPLLHIADATAEAIKKSTAKNISLFGTRFTMEEDFYKQRLATKHGLQVNVPNPQDREIINRVIYEELVKGVISQDSRAAFIEIANRQIAAGADGIIAGCTEIELLLQSEDLSVEYFPTTYIHASMAADFALGY